MGKLLCLENEQRYLLPNPDEALVVVMAKPKAEGAVVLAANEPN